MKNLLILLVFVSSSSWAADSASFDYECEIEDRVVVGTVSVSEEQIQGDFECMDFGFKRQICWRLEKAQWGVQPNIFSSLRFDKHKHIAIDDIEADFISMGNVRFSEGAIIENSLRMSGNIFARKKHLFCTITNVIW